MCQRTVQQYFKFLDLRLRQIQRRLFPASASTSTSAASAASAVSASTSASASAVHNPSHQRKGVRRRASDEDDESEEAAADRAGKYLYGVVQKLLDLERVLRAEAPKVRLTDGARQFVMAIRNRTPPPPAPTPSAAASASAASAAASPLPQQPPASRAGSAGAGVAAAKPKAASAVPWVPGVEAKLKFELRMSRPERKPFGAEHGMTLDEARDALRVFVNTVNGPHTTATAPDVSNDALWTLVERTTRACHCVAQHHIPLPAEVESDFLCDWLLDVRHHMAAAAAAAAAAAHAD